MAQASLAVASLVLASAVATPSGPDLTEASIAESRRAGPAGLETFLEAHGEALDACGAGAGPGCEELLGALDRVAGQRGAIHSRLFWYTDLEAAKAAARASGRPILSLHLLGRLDEDFSCANSRFFRTVLYADASVARVLRDRFVLHWKSVRPAPRLTVDFGDGRRLERTLTGNSVHYVLAPDGRPVDALPGLLSPGAFLAGLDRAEAMAQAWAQGPATRREAALRAAHRAELLRLQSRLAAETASLGLVPAALAGPSDPSAPRVANADRLAVTKSVVELPLVAGMTARPDRAPQGDAPWRAIGVRHLNEARLSDSARRLVGREAGDAAGAVRRLEERIAEDTARNELDLHARLHGWFAEGSAPAELEALNARVYRELFLAPEPDDPWAGLSPDDLFVGLPEGGRVVAR
jgi:hypothetical protein